MEHAIDSIIRSQQLCESGAIRYAAELLAFDNENGTTMAPQFHRDVLAEVQDEEYERAIIGLDKFINDFLDNDPLMRIDFGGLITMLKPTLVVLANAQINGLDVSD